MLSKKKRIILYIINIIVGLMVIFPILYALSLSFMTQSEIFEFPLRFIPKGLYFGNYSNVIESVPIFRFILNSFIVASSVTIGQIVTTSLGAYAFAFYEFRGKKFLFIAILATMMIPGEAIIIANYLTISSWEWVNSYRGLIVPYLTSAMGIFLMRQFYLTIPRELREASIIDGCNSLQFLLRVVMPISRPAIGALGTYVFLATWNQYMWPLLITNDAEKRTVQIGISMLQFSESQAFGVILAGIVMILIPSILIFIVGQKQLIKGMTSGAVKG